MISINVARYGGISVIEIANELDINSVSIFMQAIEDELKAQSQALVVDMSGISYLDIDGLRGLNEALKRARRAGGDLRLARPSDPALESLQASRLDEIFSIFESLQAAIGSF